MEKGLHPSEINKMRKQKKKDVFEVWEENWDTVQMFMRLSTQWRMSMSGVTGLDYASLSWLCKLYEVKDQRILFEGLQVMELVALSFFNKKR